LAYEREEAGKTRLQRAESDPARADVSPAQAELLRLQRSGGNGAVAGVLARDDTKTKAPPPRKYGPEEQTPQTPRSMKIEGIGDVPLLAVSNPRKDGNDVMVTIDRDSPFVVQLQKRASSGGGLGKVVIALGPSAEWVLEDVYIGSVEIGAGDSGTAMITLNYRGMSVGPPAEPPGKLD
jgi:hypothetical protein